MRPLCLPALAVLVRGLSGLAAALLDTWLGFGLGAFSKLSVLNCLPSSPSSILALALAGLFFGLKVFSELACALLTFISTAAGKRKVGNSSSILPKYCYYDKIVWSVND